MIAIVLPVFAVVLCGYLFGRMRTLDKSSAKLINDYVLYVALPALLFHALAKADARELQQWGFMGATLIGIAAAFLLGVLVPRLTGGSKLPSSSIEGMAASYGTTGYMGVPLLIAAYGATAAVPAAIATILHNIPVIMTVIVLHDLWRSRAEGGASLGASLAKAARTTLTNPLTVAVAAGAAVSLSGVPLPAAFDAFTRFLGAAAGPTALFALGLGLAQLNVRKALTPDRLIAITPLVVLKIAVQPLATYLAARYLFGMEMDDVWFATAVVMAAQPIGAGVYVFATKYEHFEDETSLAIIISLALTIPSLTWLLATLQP